MEKENGRKWDGKSRVSNDTYRKRYDEIFKKEKTTSELLEEGFEEEQEYLKELEDKLWRRVTSTITLRVNK